MIDLEKVKTKEDLIQELHKDLELAKVILIILHAFTEADDGTVEDLLDYCEDSDSRDTVNEYFGM